MIQSKDFIERMLEDISRGIAKICQMRERGQYIRAMEQVRKDYDAYFEDIDIVTEQNEQRLQAYALLLKEEGEILFAEGNKNEAKEILIKACDFLAKADELSVNFDLSRLALQSNIEASLKKCM